MKKRAAKRSLIASLLALAMCVTMLVGTTFAWFTDTASTSVNRIQAGNLKIKLVNRDEEDLTDKMIRWKVKNESGAGYHLEENVLWEPGCHFRAEDFYLVNDGNLAVKYKVNLSFTGNTRLLEVLDFSITAIGGDIPAGNTTFASVEELNNYVGHLSVGDNVKFILNVSMKTTAGNEYQGMDLGNIKINVVATQYNKEYDSLGKDYDKDAELPTIAGNLPPLEDLLNAMKTGGEIPAEVAVMEPVVLETLRDVDGTPLHEASIGDGGSIIRTTINLQNVLSTGEFGWNWGAMRIKQGAEVTFKGNENGKFINTSAIACMYLEYEPKVTFESGTYETNTAFIMYGLADDSASYITINGGTFVFTGADKDNQIPFAAREDASMAFIQSPRISGLNNPGNAQITINGGVFYNCDPSAYVAAGHTVTASIVGNDMVYTVN